MKKFVTTLVASLLLAGVSPCIAQTAEVHVLNVAAASSSGTYGKMLDEIIQVCSNGDLTITQNKDVKGGAVGNLGALVNNQVFAAFMHSDVLQAAQAADSAYSKYKTLVALYPEEIHVLALRQSKEKTGGMFGVGGTIKEFNSLVDLDGFKVGAAGGGVKTEQILKGMANAGFIAITYEKGEEVMAALRAGDINAAIFVGGAPLPNIVTLSADEFKLIPLGEAISSKLGGFYRPAKITYDNLHASQVVTMAPMATIVTRELKTKKFVDTQVAFRKCFFEHLDEIKETPGFHPKWQQVMSWDRGVIPWLDLPGDMPAQQ